MLEDNPIDARIIQRHLSNSGLQFHCTLVSSGKEFIASLGQHKYDVILSDHQLPDFDSIQALQERNKKNSTVPFILITGAISEEIAIAILKEGANDYILKDRLQRLPIAIEDAIKKQEIEKEKISVEKALTDLTDRFHLTAKTSLDVIWDFDITNKVIYCSNALERIVGIPGGQNYLPGYLKKFIHPDDLFAVEKSFVQIVRGKDHRWRKLYRMIRTDGTIAYINNNALVLRDKNENPQRIIGVMQDVTEIRRLQHELMDHELQKQRQITEITIQAQEKERSEIGKELHDNVNQLLATAKIMIDTARAIPEMHDLCLSKSQESIMDAIHELRNISHAMMPPSFENTDFDEIISVLVQNVKLSRQIHLTVCLPPNEILKSMNGNIKLAFYRILQEQISNILKYSKAKNVAITLEQSSGFFLLSIMDDGIGFDPTKKSSGIGLKNIKSRSELFNGTVEIITAPDQGCTLIIQIPVKELLTV